MSDAEERTDDSGRCVLGGRSSSVVVEDLSEDRGVDGHSCGSSTFEQTSENGTQRQAKATYGADPDVEGRSR